MRKILLILNIIFIVLNSANAQKFIDVVSGIEKKTKLRVSATLANSLYTDNGNIEFKNIDSITFYYEPSQAVLQNLEKNNIIYKIKRVDITELVQPEDRSKLDWIIINAGDTLFGNVTIEYEKVIYNDPLTNSTIKIKGKKLLGLKKNQSIYENIDGLKLLHIKGHISLYSEKTVNNYGGWTVRYFLYNSHDDQLTKIAAEHNVGWSKYFKSVGIEYFKHCTSLVTKIMKGEIKDKDVAIAVNYFNTNCANN